MGIRSQHTVNMVNAISNADIEQRPSQVDGDQSFKIIGESKLRKQPKGKSNAQASQKMVMTNSNMWPLAMVYNEPDLTVVEKTVDRLLEMHNSQRVKHLEK